MLFQLRVVSAVLTASTNQMLCPNRIHTNYMKYVIHSYLSVTIKEINILCYFILSGNAICLPTDYNFEN